MNDGGVWRVPPDFPDPASSKIYFPNLGVFIFNLKLFKNFRSSFRCGSAPNLPSRNNPGVAAAVDDARRLACPPRHRYASCRRPPSVAAPPSPLLPLFHNDAWPVVSRRGRARCSRVAADGADRRCPSITGSVTCGRAASLIPPPSSLPLPSPRPPSPPPPSLPPSLRRLRGRHFLRLLAPAPTVSTGQVGAAAEETVGADGGRGLTGALTPVGGNIVAAADGRAADTAVVRGRWPLCRAAAAGYVSHVADDSSAPAPAAAATYVVDAAASTGQRAPPLLFRHAPRSPSTVTRRWPTFPRPALAAVMRGIQHAAWWRRGGALLPGGCGHQCRRRRRRRCCR